ncbi:MAG TPA: DUF1800 domain-containing protein [Pyrinomonadaceae bacterium]|jgi:hypothetical protein|nr:DUF1800 domain-containing protein [Pyrinomonadaceae bacterium]
MTKLYKPRSAASVWLRLCACASLLFALSSPRADAQVLPGSPVLLTEGTGTTTRAVAYEAITFSPEPFTVQSPYNWNADKSNARDRQTRVMLFAMNLSLLVGEGGNALTASAVDAAGRVYPLKVEAVAHPKYLRLLPSPENPDTLVPTEVAQNWLYAVTLRLDDAMTENLGDVLVSLSLHGLRSNRARIKIGQGTASPAVDSAVEFAAPAPAVEPTPLVPLAVKAYGPNEAGEADAVRLLEQATWGPTNAEVTRVRALGLRAFVEEQLNTPPLFPEVGSDYPPMTFPMDGTGTSCQSAPSPTVCGRENYLPYPVQTRFFTNAFYGGDQLRQRVAWALHQILTVSAREVPIPSGYTVYLQTIDRNAFGNYRTLLREMTLNPAMGQYLDMRRSTAGNPNENFAREVLQLFSVGVDELNLDGTPKLDAGGRRVPTYTQDTVNNFTRVFTGWDLDLPLGSAVSNFRDPMVPRTGSIVTHDTGAKTLLRGAVLPACPGSLTSQECARRDLDAAIDNLFNHPNVGPFVGRQLIQHLVTSNPSPAYVERAARAFNDDCDALYPEQGCAHARGNLKAVVRNILLDPEARGDLKTDPHYGRLREPVQFMNNVFRAFDARSFDRSTESDGVLAAFTVAPDFAGAMDQTVYRPVSVFGYFTPDYVVPGANVYGPPFAILTTSTTLARANFVNTFVHTGLAPNSTPAAGPSRPRGTSIDLSPLVALAADSGQLVSFLDRLMLHGTMSQGMRASLIKAVESIPVSDANFAGKRAQLALYVVATSQQYEVQR